MKRYGCCVMFVTVLMVGSTAWGQSTSTVSTDTSAVANASTDTSGQTDSSIGQAIKQQLRSSMAQVFVGMIHDLFVNLRTSLGLPAVPTDPTTDFLAILESTVTGVVTNSVGQ